MPGYRGFVIGRSIWFDPLKGWRAGTHDRAALARMSAETYRRFMEVYEEASSGRA